MQQLRTKTERRKTRKRGQLRPRVPALEMQDRIPSAWLLLAPRTARFADRFLV